MDLKKEYVVKGFVIPESFRIRVERINGIDYEICSLGMRFVEIYDDTYFYKRNKEFVINFFDKFHNDNIIDYVRHCYVGGSRINVIGKPYGLVVKNIKISTKEKQFIKPCSVIKLNVKCLDDVEEIRGCVPYKQTPFNKKIALYYGK